MASQQTMTYDQFNNQTELAEYDYGASSPTRRTDTTYETASSYTDAVAATHLLRSLPQQKSVYDSSSTEQARTTYQYDTAGNLTQLSQLLAPPGQPIANGRNLTTTRQYDTNGNVTEVTDPRNIVTQLHYTGYNSACLTSVVKANRTVSAECDLQADSTQAGAWEGTAKVTQITDANTVQATYTYDDSLDRLKKVTLASNLPSSETSVQYNYDDTNLIVSTERDRDTLGDGLLRTDTVFDTLSRPIQTRRSSGVVRSWAGSMCRRVKML